MVVPGGSEGPKRWPFGTAAFSWCPEAIAGPTEAPVAATPGCWVSVMSKKSPLTAPCAPRASASRETGRRAATAPGVSRSTETRLLRRSTVSRCPCACPCEAAKVNSRYCTPGASAAARLS